MKRKNILKFISLLGVGSFVALSATSCKTEKVVKPAKPTDPNNGGNTTTTPASTGGGTSTTNPGGGSDGSNNMSPSEPTNSKKAVEAYVSRLTADSFKLVDSMNKELVKEETKVDQIQPTNIKLKDESDPAIQGWTLGVELVSNSDSSNPGNGTLKFKVKFSKESVEVTSNEITISGFKTLQTAVAKVLLKEMTIKDSNGQDVKKNLLDLGSAGFKTLVDLNKQGVVGTSTGATGEASAQPTTRASLVEMSGTPQAQPQPEVTQDQTSGLNNEFKTLIHGDSSEYKTKLDKIKESYPDFNPDNLYLSGKAKLVNLWKANEGWHGNYYLTSKDDIDNKLSIRYKGKDWSIDLTDGLFIQDLLPDSVNVFVSKIDNQTVTIEEQNNLEAYKNQINAEKSYNGAEKTNNNKYSFDESKGILTVNPDKIYNNDMQMPVVVNPIKIPYTIPNNTEKILFKVKYSFDGIGFYNGDIFGTKLLFKKIHKWDFDNDNNAAIKSQKVASIWLGTNYIPRKTTAEIDIQAVKSKNSDFNTWPNWDEYFSKGNQNDKGFENAIQGSENSINGNGVSQLIMKSGDKTYAPGGGVNAQTDSKYNLNNNKATNFIVFSRVSYIKNNQNDDQKWGYLWSNSITLLHVDAPVTAS
ncbi:hypothetical protein [Mycoplasma bradburyae]|uniref:Uncharacterized protein n=1 Tax=Mycoplasma bradburyae TaxID=2963128 RepID=A0ABT5GAP1_9MOLU|nr:hypothetical protein [Mycoplasma bradburyae]MDC4181762.1 hypothetical protein [Mycoplasma bradburyae]UTS69818.1 hypothetical protein NMG68_02210 [Mycoplasma bradburyae]